MTEERLKRQINFLVEMDKLKTVFRRAYLAADPDRRENSAEHSWHMAMMALILEEYAEKAIDLPKLIKMLLIHDIVEIDAGDTVMWDEKAARDKAEKERRAARRIFGLLPEDQRQELNALWEEHEEGKTLEARLATAFDRLMPLLHNFYTRGKRWQEDGITYEQVSALYRNGMQGCRLLQEFAVSMIEECVTRGYLPKPVA